MAATIPEPARRLFDEPNFASMATVMPDGMPQVTPVWVERDEDVVVINTAKGRAKHRNLERDPRVAVMVIDGDNPYSYVQVRGHAEFVEEGADESIDGLAKKYLGVDVYPGHNPHEQRIIVRIVPDAVDWHPPHREAPRR